MGAKNYRGVYVPTAGEDILAGTTALAESLGVITRVASIAVARQIVAANRGTVTSANPMYFEINGLLYVHDGGVFKPVNEGETSVTTYNKNWSSTLKPTVWTGMTWAQLPTQPYDRAFTAIGQAWGNATAGNPFLCLRVNGVHTAMSKFTVGDAQSVTVVDAGIIPAGTEPDIGIGIYAGSSGGESALRLTADMRLNRLVVTTTPITMR